VAPLKAETGCVKSSAYGLKGRTIKWRIIITHTLITKRLKQWRLLSSELDSREQYEQFLELVKEDLEERKQLFMGRPAFLYWSGGGGGKPKRKWLFYFLEKFD